jgi:hypothetical protein
MSNPIRTGWTPFKIPATPDVSSKSIGGKIDPGDPYILSPKVGSNPEKNPSQFLEYNQIPIKDILKRLADLENNPSSGLPDGAIAKEFDVCENGVSTSYWFIVWNAEPNLAIQ